MLNHDEISRLAAMAHALRPDWPIKSLCTWLAADHATRAYRDVAIALTAVACDPASVTPKRMNEAGPWWSAVQTAFGATHSGTGAVPGPNDPRCTEHPSEHIRNCRSCRSEQLEAAAVDQPTIVALTPEQIETNARGARRVRAVLSRQENR